jgi:hypothetical protein|tara:strand:+ start:124 stop:309 length:186 start_codon:yes stop_codon:yes gene_type:complete
MENVDIKVEGDIMTIKVDLSKEQGLSKSGKTIIIASTGPGHKLTRTDSPQDVVVGLNVYRK